jgi:hypothetical protein
MRALATAALAIHAYGAVACATPPLTLHAPTCAPAAAREPTRVDLEPLVLGKGAAVAAPGLANASDPTMVLTSGITSELGARALHRAGSAPSGDPAGGYVARCTLDRFAIRTASPLAILYVDLSCALEQSLDHTLVWRGELRGRSASNGPGDLDARATRLMSDVSRELASDVAIRVLGLAASPSARVFADEAASHLSAGFDDTPLGPAALADAPAAVQGVLPSLKDPDAKTRAAAWNVVAMASSPGDPWLAGASMALDSEALVRFFQYKSLARLGSSTSLNELQRALTREDEPLLVEMLRDSIQSGGVGVRRNAGGPAPSPNAPAAPSAPTKGSTTSP